MTPEIFYRKPFPVQAIRVTQENLYDVASWCTGQVKETTARTGTVKQYVKVEVISPRNIKQTMAFPGDWVLRAGASFKVYSDKAFKDTFDPATVFDTIVQDDHNYGAVIGSQA